MRSSSKSEVSKCTGSSRKSVRRVVGKCCSLLRYLMWVIRQLRVYFLTMSISLYRLPHVPTSKTEAKSLRAAVCGYLSGANRRTRPAPLLHRKPISTKHQRVLAPFPSSLLPFDDSGGITFLIHSLTPLSCVYAPLPFPRTLIHSARRPTMPVASVVVSQAHFVTPVTCQGRQ